MLRLARRILNDLLSGRNIETYAVTAVALLVAVLSVVEDVVPLDLQMAAILAALALLVFKSSAPETSPVDLDMVLRDRQSYGPFREFIHNSSVLWIYGPSAVNVLTHSPDIEREILARGGEVRVLIQDPEQQPAIDILHRQLDDMSYLLPDDIRRAVSILETLKRRYDRLDYRFVPFSPGYSMVIVEPDGREGQLVIEFFGYNSPSINDRMHVEIRRNQSNYWFEYWAAQYQSMWESARKPEEPR